MNILLVGAGAVGQAYGRHFQRGGAKITFLVRPKYEEELRQGFDMYPLNERKAKDGPVHFSDFDVITNNSEVEAGSWDAVVLCMSSTALRGGTWFREFAERIGDALVVSLCPGPKDNTFVLESVPEERAVFGLIGLTSYPGPLEGETLPKPGMVYWVPPGTKMAFSGPKEPTQTIVTLLNKGGLPSKEVESTAVAAAFASPLLQMVIVALELVGWKFRDLRKDKETMKLAYSAMREAFALAEVRMEARTPMGMRLVRPWNLRALLSVVPCVAPIDMERFFEKHFTKVGDQTEDTVRTLISLAEKHELSNDALVTLLERLTEVRTQAAGQEQPAA